MFVVEFPGRGRVTWRDGVVSVDGLRDERPLELERAVKAVLEMEGVDVKVASQVRHALLSIAGAQLVEEKPGRPDDGVGNGAP